MIQVWNLMELETEVLINALMLGEGMTERPDITDVLDQRMITSTWVMTEGGQRELPLLVLYTVTIYDDVNNEELNCEIYVEVTSVGLEGKF